jgi:CheY-like chemotaxis protein
MNEIREICLIEDDKIQIFLLKKFIEKTGLVKSVNIFENGKLAFDELKRRVDTNGELPEIIFLDINMPVWDGWQFYESFLKLPGNGSVTTFILTSSLSDVDKIKGKKFELEDRYLLKPLKFEKLQSILGSFCGVMD